MCPLLESPVLLLHNGLGSYFLNRGTIKSQNLLDIVSDNYVCYTPFQRSGFGLSLGRDSYECNEVSSNCSSLMEDIDKAVGTCCGYCDSKFPLAVTEFLNVDTLKLGHLLCSGHLHN